MTIFEILSFRKWLWKAHKMGQEFGGNQGFKWERMSRAPAMVRLSLLLPCEKIEKTRNSSLPFDYHSENNSKIVLDAVLEKKKHFIFPLLLGEEEGD